MRWVELVVGAVTVAVTVVYFLWFRPVPREEQPVTEIVEIEEEARVAPSSVDQEESEEDHIPVPELFTPQKQVFTSWKDLYTARIVFCGASYSLVRPLSPHPHR